MKATVLATFETSRPDILTSKIHIPLFSIAFAVLAGLVFIMNSNGVVPKTSQVAEMPTVATSPMATQSTRGFSEAGFGAGGAGISNKTMMAPVPVTDTREFLKTDYNATIRTRDISTLTRRIETTVRGFGGRIDSSNSSQKWGSVSFVVPAGKFDSFRDEIESLTDARFITTEIRNENLLPQVRNIEANGDWLAAQNVVNQIMTVRGTISLNWISIWDIIQLYVSGSWIIVILLCVALISYLFERRRRFC